MPESDEEDLGQGPVNGLWREFLGTRSTKARDELVVHYAPLVKYVASRVAVNLPDTVDREDLASAGILGLMEAVTKFEPGRGYKFEAYAATRIRGAIIDDLRTLDWAPRSVRRQARDVQEVLGKLRDELGRHPRDEEVAERMGVTVKKLRSIYAEVSTVLFLSLDRLMSGPDRSDGLSLVDTLEDVDAVDPADAAEKNEMRRFLADAIAGLPERARASLTLYYYEGLSLAEISEVLGLSQARLSQMNARSVLQLRSMLKRGVKP
ncbi:MAG: FliA/WhiG family RNA polymerase sigma factor [Actinomycetota bacterium]